MQNEKKRKDAFPSLCVAPEDRLCPEYDAAGIALDEVATAEKMGMRVVDNCAQEHEM